MMEGHTNSHVSMRLGAHAGGTGLNYGGYDENGDHRLDTTTLATDPQSQGLLDFHARSDGSDIGHSASSSPEAIPLQRSPLTTPGAHKSLTYLNCLALVIGMQIGSGIFSAPAVVSSHVSSPVAGVLVWTLAGLLIWTGASCFVELGITIPTNGGMQEYLCMGHGDFAAFLFSCVWLAIVRPCTIAMIALVFAEHINGLVLPALGLSGGWFANKIMALIAVFGTTAVNCVGIKTGAKVAGWFLVLKILIILTIMGAGLVVGIRDNGGYLSVKADVASQSRRLLERGQQSKSAIWVAFGEYAASAFAALWVMGGWDAVGFVVGEMKDPVRDLPRVLHSAMFIVVIGFTLTVTALYIVLPISVVREKDTPVVAFGNALYGFAGFLVYTIAISLSALGSINSNVFAVGRLVVAASQRGYIPHYFATDGNKGIGMAEDEGRFRVTTWKWWPSCVSGYFAKFANSTRRLRLEEGVPIYAMLLTAIITSIYIVLGTFRSLVVFIGITEYLMYILTVLALFRIRQRSSSPSASSIALHKSLSTGLYRTSLVNPIVFCLASFTLIARALVDEPFQCGAIIGVLVIIWIIWLRR